MNNKLKEAIAVVDEVLNDPLIGCDVTVMQEQALLTLISLAKASLEVELPEALLGALARGYCSKENEHKIVDPTLIEAMVAECRPILAGYRVREEALKQQLAEMEEAKCRYQKSLGKVTKELWDIKGRASVEEIKDIVIKHTYAHIRSGIGDTVVEIGGQRKAAQAIHNHLLGKEKGR